MIGIGPEKRGHSPLAFCVRARLDGAKWCRRLSLAASGLRFAFLGVGYGTGWHGSESLTFQLQLECPSQVAVWLGFCR